MGLQLLSAPTAEPVDPIVAKAFLRLLDDVFDDLVGSLIKAGRERCERVTGRALVSQQWKLTLPGWPGDRVIRLPKPPLLTVDLVQYAAAGDGTLTTLAADQYRVDATTEPGTITPAFGATWPAVRAQTSAVQVTFAAGYGAAAAAVPEEIRQRLLNYAAYCFEHPVERDEAFLDRLFEGFACGTYA